ncbi:HAMP domain-containing sensor histidine kinase [Paenibacillus vulneris]|uniref:histidine kinase n=1 Tax=Paenibacillus vulneris TaxID=1133364 RepID=A0ABW3UMH7_9BACL
MTIRMRLTLLYSGILTCVLLLFSAALYIFLEASIYNDLKKSLKAQTAQIHQHIAYQLEISPRGSNLVIGLDDLDTVSSGMYIQITNFLSGTKSKTVNLSHAELPYSSQALTRNQEEEYSVVPIHNTSFLIYSEPLVWNGSTVGVLQAAYNVGVMERFLANLRWILGLLAIIVVTLAAYIGWLFSRKALKPIYSLAAAARKIRHSDDFGTRIQYQGPIDEIGLLSETMNQMLERIQTIYAKLDQSSMMQRRFVADASHELRTPLTSIQGNAEFLKNVWGASNRKRPHTPEEIEISLEALQDITDASERMGRLVNDLLSLARADSGLQMSRDVWELRSIIETVLSKVESIPKHVNWAVEKAELTQGIRIVGDRDYLQRMLLLFIENAFKFTSQGAVKLSIEKEEYRIGFRIEDTGIGMSEEEIAHIFDRFYRADSSRGMTPGSGLGLSIAKWILEEHGGTVHVRSTKGAGSAFSIWLPIYGGNDCGSAALTEGDSV